MESFLRHFQTYLESDGRHHVWVVSVPTNATLVFDNHNLIYAYGPLDEFVPILLQRGFSEQEAPIPVPHVHHYHEGFDSSEREIMAYWNWQQFPLAEGDDD
jgi:hypothetical protein